MQFEIKDHANVYVDGQHAGAVTDVLDNHARDSGSRSAMLTALQAWHQSIRDDHAAKLAAWHESLQKDHEAELAKVRTEHEQTLAGLKAEHADELARVRDDARMTYQRQVRELKDQHEDEIAALKRQVGPWPLNSAPCGGPK